VESLFDFIFSNLFFVILVIGGIMSFFNRMSRGGEEGEQQNRPGRQPQPPPGQRQQRQEEQVDWREIFKQEQPQARTEQDRPEPRFEERPVSFEPVSQQKEVAEGVDRQQELYDRYERLKDKKREAVNQFERMVPQKPVEGSEKRSKLDLELNRLSNKEAMKAVVWAEVLGKPRGKNPHQTFSQIRRQR
jgi:hypothetical protein